MRRVTLERGDGLDLEPGEYLPLQGGDEESAIVACPGCGEEASLTDHGIAADGTVNPSLICPHDGCDFHEFVRLEEWEGGQG